MHRKLQSLGTPLTALAMLFVAFACADASKPGAERSREEVSSEAQGGEADRPRAEVVSELPRVLFLGTSLTAGLGLSEEEAYPARLSSLLEGSGRPIEAINAGVSGDTSAGGLERLDWLLRSSPDVVLIELGANDGLRGLPPDMTEANLRTAISRANAAGARVIVAGMLMPPNYGEDYAREFAAVFPRVAEDTGSMLVAFLLDGVAADPALNLADGIHPNAAGHERIAENLLPVLLRELDPALAP